MRLALTLLTFAFLAIAPALAHSSSLTIFYNGTVNAVLSGVGSFNLVGHNVTPIKVVGSGFRIEGGVIYFSNESNVTLSYVASLNRGVISFDEPYPLNVTIYIPSNSTVTYMSPVPESFSLQGDYYKLSFYSNNATVLYYFLPVVKGSESNSQPVYAQPNYALIYALIASLVGINGFLAFSLLRTLKERKKEKVIVEQVEVAKAQAEEGEEFHVEERLNDRDLLVLEAINKGNYTLSDIMKFTKLPKTTTYRRLKKLVSLGYVEEVKKEGRTFYVPKNRSGTGS